MAGLHKSRGRPNNKMVQERMGIRNRKIFGMALLIVGLAVYALAGVYVAVTYIPDHWLVQLAYYAIAGVGWAFPAKSLLTWIHAPLAG